jgi:hypothetical protein
MVKDGDIQESFAFGLINLQLCSCLKAQRVIQKVTGSHAQEKIRIVKSLHVSWEGLSFSIK